MKRTDIHRPSAINPVDYEYVAIEYMKMDFIGDCQAMEYERKVIEAHMKRTGGTYSNHEHKGNCHICGAHCIYTVLFYHQATNSYIRTGMDCASKMHMGDEHLFRKFKDAVEAYKVARAGKLKAQGVLAESGLDKAWEIYELATKQGTTGFNKDQFIIQEMVYKLVKYGNISDKQINFLRILVDRVNKAPQIEAQRQAEKAAAKDCPTGRVTVEAEVIKTEYRDSAYGESLKMLVKAAEGFMLWGTVPSDLQLFEANGVQRGLKRGDRISLTATLTPSDKDTKFGFFKRPIAKLVAAINFQD